MSDGRRPPKVVHDDKQFTITRIYGTRPPRVAPNPDYPDGVPLVAIAPETLPRCTVNLPYPNEPVIGTHTVLCKWCGMSVAITIAGRPDDPRAVSFPCKADRGRGGRA